jgi:hypothetical protein
VLASRHSCLDKIRALRSNRYVVQGDTKQRMTFPLRLLADVATATAGGALVTAGMVTAALASLALVLGCSSEEFAGCEANLTCDEGQQAGAGGSAGAGEAAAAL